MPLHRGILPREGFKLDAVLGLVGKTVLNPALLLPLVLVARYTQKGVDLSLLHATAYGRIKTLLCLGLLRWANHYLSRGAVNNWVPDGYDWSEEIVLITGGASGIGGEVVKLLAERGIKVVVLDIQPLTFAAPSTVFYYPCDITSSGAIASVAQRIRAHVGEPTVLINNAGVARGKQLLDASEHDVRFTFDVNVFSHYWLIKEFLPAMVRRDHGMVVTVASIASFVTTSNMVDYAASKHAAQAFHEGLATELKTCYGAPRVRTVVVNQAYTRTPLFRGFAEQAPFLVPALEVGTVADAIVRQVLRGESGQLVLPAMGNLMTMLPAMPLWWQHATRVRAADAMNNWSGHQVVRDLKDYYASKEKSADGGEASTGDESSTVLVSHEK